MKIKIRIGIGSKQFKAGKYMNTEEVIQAVKETHLWESLPPKEKRETIINALEMFNVPVDEEEIQSIVGEDLSDTEELQDLGDFCFNI